MLSRRFVILTIFSSFVAVPVSSDTLQEGIIETRILDFDPQSGVKSQHFYYIDFDNKTVEGNFSTGSTSIDLGVIQFDVDSVRDNFTLSDIDFRSNEVSFVIRGTTASGILVMPDIDYRFEITAKKDGSVSVSGCHDAYPAYLVQHNGENIYQFTHKSLDLIKLAGTCDVQVR